MSDLQEKMEDSEMIQKGKQKALKIVFSRTMVIVVLLLIQIALIGAVMQYFSHHMPVFIGGHMLFGLGIVLTIINKEGSPEVKLSWTIITMLLPLVGGLFYLFVKMQ